MGENVGGKDYMIQFVILSKLRRIVCGHHGIFSRDLEPLKYKSRLKSKDVLIFLKLSFSLTRVSLTDSLTTLFTDNVTINLFYHISVVCVDPPMNLKLYYTFPSLAIFDGQNR